MAGKRNTKKMDVQLKCSLGRGGKEGKPGEIKALSEEDALELIKAGHAVEYTGVQPVDGAASERIMELEQTVADLRGDLAAVQEDCAAKLDQAKAYASALEDRCKAAGVDIADLTGTGK
jgi:hypothetical protein